MINHKAVAEEIAVSKVTVADDVRGMAILAFGQLSATLYLAEQTAALMEQHRIANLIAWAERLAGPSADLAHLHDDDVTAFRMIVAEVTEKLGLS